jgi:hypothetical protein
MAVPAAERLGASPRTTWPGFLRQLGEVARTIHAVRGPYFGPVAGPGYTTWSEALTASFTDIAALHPVSPVRHRDPPHRLHHQHN